MPTAIISKLQTMLWDTRPFSLDMGFTVREPNLSPALTRRPRRASNRIARPIATSSIGQNCQLRVQRRSDGVCGEHLPDASGDQRQQPEITGARGTIAKHAQLNHSSQENQEARRNEACRRNPRSSFHREWPNARHGASSDSHAVAAHGRRIEGMRGQVSRFSANGG